MLAACLVARLAGRPAAARARTAAADRSGSATASSTACCSRCSRWCSRSRRASALETVIRPAVFRLAIPILVSLVVIRLSVRVLTAPFPAVALGADRRAQHLVDRLDRRRCSGSPASADGARRDGRACSWKIGGDQVSLRNLVEGTITAGVVLVLALWISAALERRLLASDSGQDLSLRKIAATLLRAVLLFVGLMFALSAVGIDLTALSVLGGALGVGLGFGLQKIAANYVSGFVILAERSMRIGDMVKVDNFEGRITDIRTRYTVIRSLTGREAIIPNETLITTRVENSSLADPRVLVQTTVQVAYGTDVRELQPVLQAAVAAVPRVVDEPGAGRAAGGLRRRRHRAHRQLLDPRPGERPGQRQVGGQPRGARRPARRAHRLSVRAADGAGDGLEGRGCGRRAARSHAPPSPAPAAPSVPKTS